MNKSGINQNCSGESPSNVSVCKPSGISSIFNWFGKKNKNKLPSSFCPFSGKNCFKLNSLDLDSLNINSDDVKVLKSALKMNQNGNRVNIFNIPKHQLGVGEDELIRKVITTNLIKSKKEQISKEKCLWSSSSLSITSKQKTHKACNFSKVRRMKSLKSLAKSSSSSSKTTLNVHYKKSSKLNIPKHTYKSILMTSIPPDILKSNIENPVFVPIRCIGKRNTELANNATNEPNYIEQDILKDLETKTKVIPVLMKKIQSMEDQISTISSATKQVKVVSEQDVLSELYSKSTEQTHTPLNLGRTRSPKLLANAATRKNKRVKAKRFKTRRQSLASQTSPFNSASESCKNLTFVFGPKSCAFNSSTSKNETPKPTRCQTLPQEAKLVKGTNKPIQTLFDAYPNVGCDTILKMYKDRSDENDSTRPRKEIGNSASQIDSNEGSKRKPLESLFKDAGFGKMIDVKDVPEFLQQLHNFPSINVFDLTSETGHLATSLIDLSPAFENNTTATENPLSCSMDKLNVNVSPKDIDDVLNVSSENVVTRNEICPKCRCRTSELFGEDLKEKTNEMENNYENNVVMIESKDEMAFESEEKLKDSQEIFGANCDEFQDTCTAMPSYAQFYDNASIKKSENFHDIQPENIVDWIQKAFSNKDNKPEVSIAIQVKDENKCLILESLTPKLLEADTNNNIDGNHRETDDGYGVSEPKVLSYNTRSILTTSEGVQHDKDPSKFRFKPLPKCKKYPKTISTDDIPLTNDEFEKKDRRFYSLENITPVKSFEFESAGRGDVHPPTIKASWSPVGKESKIEREEKELVLNGRCNYLNRKRRAIFEEQIRSKTSISGYTDRPTPKITFAHCEVNDGIGDSMLESLDTIHSRLDSDPVSNECSLIMQLGYDNVINMPSEIFKYQDNVPTLSSRIDSKCFRYDSVFENDPRGKPDIEQVIPKATRPPGFFRCIETDPDFEKDKKIEVESKRRPTRCGLTLLQDIEESEEELADKVGFYKNGMGDDIEITTNQSVNEDEKNIAETIVPRKSSVSVQTDWSLVGITVDHFRSWTWLANRDKPSVGCQTEEIIDADKKLVFSSSLLTDSIVSSEFCEIPSGTSLTYPGLHFAANSGGENAKINVSELFLNVMQQNGELENNARDLDTADTLGNTGKVETLRELVSIVSADESSVQAGFQDVRSYGFKINTLSVEGYKSETKHTCCHPCFPSFSDEIIDSDVDILGSDAFVQPSACGFPPNGSLMSSDIINIGNHESDTSTHPYAFNENVDVNLPTKSNSVCKESSVSRLPIVSEVISPPQTMNEYADVYEFGSNYVSSSSANNFRNLTNIVDSTPVGGIRDATQTEGTSPDHRAVIKKHVTCHNSYVVNYLYEIKYDILGDTICCYE